MCSDFGAPFLMIAVHMWFGELRLNTVLPGDDRHVAKSRADDLSRRLSGAKRDLGPYPVSCDQINNVGGVVPRCQT